MNPRILSLRPESDSNTESALLLLRPEAVTFFEHDRSVTPDRSIKDEEQHERQLRTARSVDQLIYPLD